MKRLSKALSVVVIFFLLTAQQLQADSTLRITKVQATFLGKTVDVMRKVMEIDGGTSEKVSLNIETSGGSASKTYMLVQYDKSTTTVAKATTNKLSFDPTEVDPGKPLYLSVRDSAGQQQTILVNFRINIGEVNKTVPDTVASEFGSGITIDLSNKLPGCRFSFLPFAIPVTVKTYGDGRVVLGMGYNHKDATFWNDAANGKFPPMDNFSKIRDVVLSEQNKSFKDDPKCMGLIFCISGWAEGNVNPKQPWRGKIQLYVGTGMATGGQYAILTWDVVLTGGATGGFDFDIIYNESESKRDFYWERILVGLLANLEVYGGIGLYSIASLGIYGAASVGVDFELLPLQTVNSLIMAGELGFKVKVLGKSILTFTLISGSHDFLDNKLTGYLNLNNNAERIQSYLLNNDYGSAVGVTLKGREITESSWHGQISEDPKISNDWEVDPDFAHLLAEDIYPDSHVQLVKVQGKAFPQMNFLFLSNKSEWGNQPVLMNSYYDMATNFLSDPYVVDSYNYTADYDPVTYYDEINKETYLVWRDAQTPVTDDMTLSEIAANTEIAYMKFWVGSDWWEKQTLTDYGTTRPGICAVGGRPSSGENGNAVVTWYTTSTDDPLALQGEHEIWMAVQDPDNQYRWTTEKQFTVSGMVSDVRSFWFRRAQTIAVSMTDENGESSVSLWQNGSKIWEKKNAANGKFVFMGYEYRTFCWFQDGRLWRMNESGNEEAITPEDMIIPTSDYELYGTFGGSSVMLVGRGAAKSEENAFAIFSTNGGVSWARVPLTDIDPHALVDHIAVGYTYENEPIIVYSVQNYVSNFEESRLDASTYFNGGEAPALQNIQELSLSGEDPRFTDTHADLYIKARKANSHITANEAWAKDSDSIVPGGKAEINVVLFNNGLYPVDHADIYCGGEKVGELNEEIKPGATRTVKAYLPIPADPGSEELTYRLEVTSRGEGTVEGRTSLTIPGGHLEASVDHLFENMKEELSYHVTNYGYTEKTFTVLVRDEDRGVEISRERFTLKGGSSCDGAAVSPSGMYVKDGCKNNVTIYALFDGEDYDSESVDSSRIKSVVPLEEIYGQAPPVLNMENETTPTPAPAPTASAEPEPEPTHEVIVVTPTPRPAEPAAPTATPQPGEETRPSEAPESDKTAETPTAEPETVPSETPSDIENGEKKKGFPWALAAIPGIGILALFLLILFWKRNRDEEEEQ